MPRPGLVLSRRVHLPEVGLTSPRAFAIIHSEVKTNPVGVCSYLIRSVYGEGKPLQRAEVWFPRLWLHCPGLDAHRVLTAHAYVYSAADRVIDYY